MDKRHIVNSIIFVLIILTIPLFVSACFSKEKKEKEDLFEINIIDSERNIKTISIDDLKANNMKKFKIEDIIDEGYYDALVMGQLGEIEYIRDGDFKLQSNSVSYIDKGRKIKGVKGVMINPPTKSIMDSYQDMSNYLLEEEKVLCFLLDGFGYHQYLYAMENGYLPFLSGQEKAEKAHSVYRPVTNAGLAAILTGKTPEENGVYSRSQRELKVASIFQLAKDLDKKAMYIEGDIGILKTEIEPILNMDINGDGFTDDEVFQSTLQAINGEYDLIFTHFHGIDDCGHSYGDLDSETLEFIARVDRHLKELALAWDGKIIITADHGMHLTEYGGDHGEFRYEDIIVPYMVFDGGEQLE